MKDFTLHPEALELKQLGFDEPCLFYYYGSNDLQSLIQIDMPRLVNHNESILGTCYSAPTYSQAFRWFRENHNCDVKIEMESKEFYIGFYWSGVAWVSIGSGTYEEAELACLKHLIKTVKENKGGDQC